MREPFGMFYFMLPVFVPALIACGWGLAITIREQMRAVSR
jgi:hypothetical protein